MKTIYRSQFFDIYAFKAPTLAIVMIFEREKLASKENPNYFRTRYSMALGLLRYRFNIDAFRYKGTP